VIFTERSAGQDKTVGGCSIEEQEDTLDYDVIVVGGGPAGAVLAYELAKRGLGVLFIEKATLPHYKACGGGLPLKTVQSLPFDVSPAFEREAEGGIVSHGGRQLLKTEVRRPFAWLAMRDRFDHFLVQRAVEAGARLIDGLAVTSVEDQAGQVVARTRGEQFCARLLAGADGVNSVVARSVGLLSRREAGVAIEAEVTVSPSAMAAQWAYATFDFGALPHGYGWIFPKSDHLSAGVFQARPGKAVGLKRDLERFVASQTVLQDHRRLSLQGGMQMHRLRHGRRHHPPRRRAGDVSDPGRPSLRAEGRKSLGPVRQVAQVAAF